MFACCCADAPEGRMGTISQERIVSQAPAVSDSPATEPPIKEQTEADVAVGDTAQAGEQPSVEAPPQEETAAASKDESKTFTVVLVKDHRKLGMEIGHSEADGILKVQAVRKGTSSADWNEAHPDKKICEGYFILEIQDEKVRDMTLEDIRGKLEAATEVKLLLSKTQPPSKRFDAPKTE
mmetsp:Transcript_17495/g.39412  ORF Transcript_17495/g.39412 Transcript_17495/m.39412 type:complete len:180 (-) Transcript_17495:13-552(-)